MGTDSRDIVAVRVTRHLPMGLGVEAEDGTPGIIRVREISWDPGNVAHWKEAYPVGWTGEAYPLSVRKGSIQEFSLRLAESDPWEDVPATIKRGQWYEGRVTGIVNYGAFIEIAAGITGLLHRSKLPPWAKASPIDLFWPGDRVFVTIQDIDFRDRKISLGFPEFTRPTRHASTTQDLQSSGSYVDFDHEVDILLKQTTRKKHYMIVEDDPQQSMAMSSWLRHLGQQVTVFLDAENALSFLEKTTPEIAFLDINLPGMSGLQLIRIMLEKWPQIFLVITTDWTNAEIVMNELEELQQQRVELLVKPFLPEDLIAVIRKTYAVQKAEPPEPQESGLVNLTLEQPITIRSNKLKKNMLDRVRRQLGFELAILFSIDKPHRQVSIVECAGGERFLNPAVTSQLVYSPVRDVAEDQSTLVVNDIQPQSRDRFRYLLELYPHLISCLGVPVTARVPAGFALFVLDRHPHQISAEQKLYTEAVALVLGTYIEQETFNERSRLIQRSALIGHLTRGMVHEINNLIAPLHSHLDNLQNRLRLREKGQPSAPPLLAESGSIMEELVEIQKNVRRIISTTRMFGRFTAKGKNEVLRIDEIVDETIHFMRDISDQAHVKITFDHPDHLLVIRNQAAALEQVLLNVLLNAVQQIAELHPDRGGWVNVSIEPPIERGERSSFTILIEDNGPGIHVSLWDRIFEAGYTTRADGSGIGLYISWNLMEELGGRIYVKESHILSGTTFGLEIPYHL
jgi:signal transduction histidine kinase/FixJ family two-component response regulator